jgi:hypothetical protein
LIVPANGACADEGIALVARCDSFLFAN